METLLDKETVALIRDYVPRKLAILHTMKECKFLCFNSIDLGSESDRALIFEELHRRFK